MHRQTASLSPGSAIARAALAFALACTLAPIAAASAPPQQAHADDPDPAAPAAAPAASPSSQEGPSNFYEDPAAYEAFGIDLNQVTGTPTDFNSDQADHPLENVKINKPLNLFVGHMNKTDYDRGQIAVADSIENFNESSTRLDTMLTNTVGNTRSIDATNWKNFQYHAHDAISFTYQGEELMVENTLYTGTYRANSKDRHSMQELLVRKYAKGKATETLAEVYNYLAPDTRFESIEQEGSLGLTAMAAGDFDGDGNDELAVYVPAWLASYLVVYRFTGTELVQEQMVYLSELDMKFATDDGSWKRPIVHLGTFGAESHEDLVINVSWPYADSYWDQGSIMRIYSRYRNGASADKLSEVFKYDPNFGSYRMRFASSLQTDFNDNGVPELIMAGHYNSYNWQDNKGAMDASRNLVQMFTYDENTHQYQFVWNEPQQVRTVPDLFVGFQMCEPAALACGTFERGQRQELFLEGVVFKLPSTESAATEADKFKGSSFAWRFGMTLTGERNRFVKKAVAGNFDKKNVLTDQLVVQSGYIDKVKNYRLTYDVRWVYEGTAGGLLAQHDTDLGFISDKDTRDNGTFLTLASCFANPDNAYQFKLKEKKYGWSAPQPLAIVGSVPFWSELEGASGYEIGDTTFGVNKGSGSGTDGSWKVGGGVTGGFSLMFGAGLLGNKVEMGGGLDFEDTLSYLGSYHTEHNQESGISYTESAGRTRVVTKAHPVVMYQYDVYVPEFTVTQQYLNEYNKNAPANKQWGPEKVGTRAGGEWQTATLNYTYDPVLTEISLEAYNEAATRYPPGTNPHDPNYTPIAPIDMDQVFKCTPGDPTTYPDNASKIANVRANTTPVVQSKPVTVAADGPGSSVSPRLAFSDSTQIANGFEVAVSAALSVIAEEEATIFIAEKGTASLGAKIELGGGASWSSCDTKGAEFSTTIHSMPSEYRDYMYGVQMAVWQTSAVASNPFVIGYLVTGAGPNDVPPSLPRYAIAYSTTDSGIVWAWSTDTTRPAGYYGIARPTSTDGWAVPNGYYAAPAQGTTVLSKTMEGLQPASAYKVRFQSYADAHLTRPSALGAEVVGYTKGGDQPRVAPGDEPKNAHAALAEKARFEVKAAQSDGGTDRLSYQWYRLDTSSSLTYASWEKIDGETGPALDVFVGDASLYHSLYCVEVVDGNPSALVMPTWRSNAVAILPPSGAPGGGGQNAAKSTRIDLALGGKNDTGGADLMRSEDEFFCNAGDTFEASLLATDSDGNGCEGTFDMVAKSLVNGQLQAGMPHTGPTDAQGASGSLGLKDPADPTARFWPGSGPRVFQLEVSFTPNDPAVLPSKAYFWLNYGAVDLGRKMRFLDYDTDGSLLGGDTQAITRFMPLPDIEPSMVAADFAQWYLDEGLTTPLTEQAAAALRESGATLFSKWNQHEFAVTYELDGGQNDPGNPAVRMNDDPTLELRDPVKPGYRFEGWFADAAFTQPVTHLYRGITADVALFAKWSLEEYPIYYAAFEGANPAGNPHSYTVHDAVSLAAPEFDPGQFKDGTGAWYRDSQFAAPAGAEIPAGSTGAVVLYANAERLAPPPGPGPNVTPTDGPGSNKTLPLAPTGDGALPWIVLAVACVAGATLVAAFVLRGRRAKK